MNAALGLDLNKQAGGYSPGWVLSSGGAAGLAEFVGGALASRLGSGPAKVAGWASAWLATRPLEVVQLADRGRIRRFLATVFSQWAAEARFSAIRRLIANLATGRRQLPGGPVDGAIEPHLVEARGAARRPAGGASPLSTSTARPMPLAQVSAKIPQIASREFGCIAPAASAEHQPGQTGSGVRARRTNAISGAPKGVEAAGVRGVRGGGHVRCSGLADGVAADVVREARG